ncbi:ribonuclease H-like domain-containing protein [Tanacetum coccineum]
MNKSFQNIVFDSSNNKVDTLNFFNDNQTPSPNDEGRGLNNSAPNEGGDAHPDHSDGQDEGDAASMGDNSYSEGNVPSSSNVDTIRGEPENSSQVQPDLRRNPKWIESMNNEIEALLRNNTWTVCDLPKGRKPVGSKWLWKIKFKSTCEIERYKSRVVAKGSSMRVVLTIMGTFSPVVKMSTVRCMLNVAICNGWDLFQLDVNNAFLYGDLTEEAPRQWNAKLGDMTLLKRLWAGQKMLKSKFQIKDLGNLKYFLGIEVIDNDDGVCLSQRKYCLEVLHEYGLLAGRPVETPLAENTTLNHVESEDDKLLKAAFRVLRYLKNSPGSGIQINKVGNLKLRAYADSDWARCPATRKSVSGYCVFLGSSLITWKSKKQSTLSRSSAEAEYRSMASATCEVIWLSNLLGDMGVKNLLPDSPK